ncbi:MAG: ATP-dependent helicase [Candidatus Rokuibacteriota bacterium]|nr:MAG: ATP-dependent helicase [Candidatus Rokubacteria bacterium]PYN16653.1 MAG: ATP-dependent helicase [Candidatus Rokubacteria bacterium]
MFDSLNLSPATIEAIRRAGYTTPTPIQLRAIPPGLAGRDLIGCAQTGTGKTAAFVIPMIERFAGQGTGLRGLVLAPTRELASQIAEALRALGTGRLRVVTVVGGEPMGPQTSGLRSRPDVVVATPGRLIDHLERGSVSLGGIRLLVLDEADRMLDMGFAPQVEAILARVPIDRQTLCFSATMPAAVERLVRRHLSRPERIEVGAVAAPVAGVTERLYAARGEDKTSLLLRLLGAEGGPTLVFTRTKRRADRLARAVSAAGHRVTRIHADRSMGERREALEGFRNGRYRVLVATDLAARGLDVPGIAHVVNFDLPHTAEDYVHRIGRTARAERTGLASSFAAPEEADQLRTIERHLGHPLLRS